jgi:hypothetical protein
MPGDIYALLPKSAYPITIKMWRQTDPWEAEPIYQAHIEGADRIAVPGFGQPTRVEVCFGDGTRVRQPVEAWEGAPDRTSQES